MADAIVLNAESRDRAGKGAARAIRRAGRVPAVIYGNKQDPEMVSINPAELMVQLRRQGFYGTVFDVKVGKKSNMVLARDVQFDPLTDRPIHVDFMRFDADHQGERRSGRELPERRNLPGHQGRRHVEYRTPYGRTGLPADRHSGIAVHRS